MKRKIYDKLLEWKNNKENKKPLMLLGVRQCGKTYIIEKFCQKEYKKFIEVNLLRNINVVDLYNENSSSEEKFLKLKSLFNITFDEDTILFIDEIQESENLISDLKFLCEVHPEANIICAGSLLGVKLKRFNKSFPVGKVWLLDMYPMSFDEFLLAFDEERYIDIIKNCFENNKPIGEPLHHILLEYYKLFLITGGLPESVSSMVNAQKDLTKYDKNILPTINEEYFNDMKKYVINNTETLKIRKIYSSLTTQLGNTSHKFQYSKVEKKSSARDFGVALDWLISSRMVDVSYNIKKPGKPIGLYTDMDTFKIYYGDVGILNSMLETDPNDILFDKLDENKGIIIENYVANELKKNNLSLYYWVSNGTAEVDFVVKLGSDIVPVEVKSADNTKSKSLTTYILKYNPNYAIRISTKDFGYNKESKIKSIPLYSAFLIKE